jgi:hypothetical protein
MLLNTHRSSFALSLLFASLCLEHMNVNFSFSAFIHEKCLVSLNGVALRFTFMQLLLEVLFFDSSTLNNSILLIPSQGTSDPYVILQLNGQIAKSNIKWA